MRGGVWLWVHGCPCAGHDCDEMMYAKDWAALSSGMYVSCGELRFGEAMRVRHCAVLLSAVIHVYFAQCARGHRGSGYGRDELCAGGCLGMQVSCSEVVCAICDVAPQDVAMPVQLEHESGGSREAAQLLHALDRELEHDAAPKSDALVLRLDLDFGLDWFPARLTGAVDELLGSKRLDDPSQDHGGVAGQRICRHFR
jgi:hypothetical protein